MVNKAKILLKKEMFKPSFRGWDVEGVFNPGVARKKNGDIVLMVRVAECAGKEHKNREICPVISSNNKGYKINEVKENDIMKKGEKFCYLPHMSHFRRVIVDKTGFEVKKIEDRVAFMGRPKKENLGVEDPRITKIGKKYYMAYVGISTRLGISVYLTSSEDLRKWGKRYLIFSEMDKNTVILPEKIEGKYVAFHRPEMSFSKYRPGIWISYSKDLIHWGEEKVLMRPRKGWESGRIGAGCPPIKTEKGWLMIYHGASKDKNDSWIYSGGTVLLDLKDPSKVIMRSPKNNPLLIPSKKFEKKGYINNVVFPTGAIKDLDGKSLLIYSGGADSIISVRKISIEEIFENMEKV